MLLTFNIKNQLIFRTDKEIPVANSENYLYAQFSFTDEWEGTKTALFGDYSIQLDENNKCLVPWEAIKEPGFSVSVFCGQRVTANVAYVDVLPSGYKEGQTPQPPSPTVYDQILDELEKRLSADDVLAGTNVTVTKNADGTITISSSGGGASYTAGTGIEIDNNEISVDFTDVQGKLTAGTGISIVNDVISATLGWSVEVLSELPASGQAQTFYFIAKQDAETGDVYDEYIWINNAFELIGSTQVDLTNYVTLTDLATELLKYYTKTQIDSLLSGKADAFTIGQNLSLSSGVLSANTLKFTTVESKPANPDLNTIYGIVAGELFPDVSDYITTDYPYIAVVKDGSNWKLVQFKTQDMWGYYGSARSLDYAVRTLVNGEWGEATEYTESDSWSEIFHLSGVDPAYYPTETNARLKEYIYYSNSNWYCQNRGSRYTPTGTPNDNKTDVYGVPIDPSLIDRRVLRCWKHNGTEWVDLGLVDYNEMFDDIYNKGEVDTALSSKANAPLVFSNLSVATTDWVADSTYTDYGYKAVLTCSGVTASMEADVYLSSASASLGVVASFCDEGTDSVTIYATSNENAITIDKVVAS